MAAFILQGEAKSALRHIKNICTGHLITYSPVKIQRESNQTWADRCGAGLSRTGGAKGWDVGQADGAERGRIPDTNSRQAPG